MAPFFAAADIAGCAKASKNGGRQRSIGLKSESVNGNKNMRNGFTGKQNGSEKSKNGGSDWKRRRTN
jgi:hypothetical protein